MRIELTSTTHDPAPHLIIVPESETDEQLIGFFRNKNAVLDSVIVPRGCQYSKHGALSIRVPSPPPVK